MIDSDWFPGYVMHSVTIDPSLTWGAICIALLLSVNSTVSSQEQLPEPQLPAAPKPISLPSVTIHPHPPKPTIVQTLASAHRGVCAHIKASPVGKIAGGMLKPLSVLTGGLIPAEKTPHPDEKAQPGPEGVAAQIKTVKIQAPKRQAAVKQLTGIDVRYHPEAEAILIAALRADPSECVRFEAATTLTTLPVCSKPIAKALSVCVSGETTDGNPSELSERVRVQAEVALAHCQCCQIDIAPGELERPEYPDSGISQASALMPLSESEVKVAPISTAMHYQERLQQPEGLINLESVDAVSPMPVPPNSEAGVSAPAANQRIIRRRPKSLADIIRAAALAE